MANDSKVETKAEHVGKSSEASKAGASSAKAGKPPQNRSPSHPALSLEEAIQRARAFYQHESFTRAAPEVAMKHWGYGAKSSSGLRTLAALLHYGLLDEQGAGPDRRVWLSERAKTIILHPNDGDPERIQAIRDAALSPKIYKILWEKWGPNLPSDRNMEYELIRNYDFNPTSIPDFIKDFKATIEFAKPTQGGKLSPDDGESQRDGHTSENGGHRNPPPPPHTRTGDTMPDIQRVDAKPLDLPIPLIGGGQATLRIPIPLSEENYKHLTTILTSMLGGMKPAIVAGVSPAPSQ
jgi:hypothetical protein